MVSTAIPEKVPLMLVDYAPDLQVEEIATMYLVVVVVAVQVDSPYLVGWKVVEADQTISENLGGNWAHANVS
jgi:hypothetical protein